MFFIKVYEAIKDHIIANFFISLVLTLLFWHLGLLEFLLCYAFSLMCSVAIDNFYILKKKNDYTITVTSMTPEEWEQHERERLRNQ